MKLVLQYSPEAIWVLAFEAPTGASPIRRRVFPYNTIKWQLLSYHQPSLLKTRPDAVNAMI